MVVDASALLAVVFGEPHGPWVLERMKEGAGKLLMSTVNLAEVLILVRDRKPRQYAALERGILRAPLRFEAPTVEQARCAAEARIRFPLHLGDCFAYALAAEHRLALLTLDNGFRRTDVDAVLPP